MVNKSIAHQKKKRMKEMSLLLLYGLAVICCLIMQLLFPGNVWYQVYIVIICAFYTFMVLA